MNVDLTDPIFSEEEAVRKHFEVRRWPDGPTCPHCGVVGETTEMKGKTTSPGLWKCRAKECRGPFTVTVGTIYERSHIPPHKWLAATQLMMSSKKGMSALQMSRELFLNPQARDHGDVSPCFTPALEPLSRRVRFSVQRPPGPQGQRP